jgi:GNAT superfamily N-acetyltransferase
MSAPLVLNKANRLKIARAFRYHQQVDLSIPCVIEGQMGAVYVDDPSNPTVYRIDTGPFWYLAGEANSQTGRRLLAELPPYTLLMPSPGGWVKAAREMYGERLQETERYSYSAETLSGEPLRRLLAGSRHKEAIQPINLEQAVAFRNEPGHFVDLSAFDSAQDFAERGLGYCLPVQGRVVAAAYSALVCSRGIEISIYVEERHRQRGIATALACRLLLDCLERGLEPHWDAANRESCRLAEKLGYRRSGVYQAYYLVE